MNGKPWHDEDERLLRRMQKLGARQHATAALLGRTRSAIKSHASEIGALQGEPFWTPAKKSHAIRMRKDGYTYRLICELMDCTMAQLKGMLHRERRK